MTITGERRQGVRRRGTAKSSQAKGPCSDDTLKSSTQLHRRSNLTVLRGIFQVNGQRHNDPAAAGWVYAAVFFIFQAIRAFVPQTS